ncbi:MAG: hypothetical protein M1826_000955 [Phylliscum demangeonii]|nr:MAG: hypothetical protein M1826_000955 [Phylliscum demangeonii]
MRLNLALRTPTGKSRVGSSNQPDQPYRRRRSGAAHADNDENDNQDGGNANNGGDHENQDVPFRARADRGRAGVVGLARALAKSGQSSPSILCFLGYEMTLRRRWIGHPIGPTTIEYLEGNEPTVFHRALVTRRPETHYAVGFARRGFEQLEHVYNSPSPPVPSPSSPWSRSWESDGESSKRPKMERFIDENPVVCDRSAPPKRLTWALGEKADEEIHVVVLVPTHEAQFWEAVQDECHHISRQHGLAAGA